MAMDEITKHYTNGEVTVVWKPNQCIHSKICWTNLLEVFDPRKRPWINMQGAATDRIAEQVSKCPSGALSSFYNDEHTVAPGVDVDTTIEVTPNGPLLVYGTVTIKDTQGNETVRYKTTALCRCGASSNKPYCDGTHVKIGFKHE